MSHYNEASFRISIALNKIKKIATIATLSCVALFNVNAEANTVEKRAARTEEIAALLPSEPSFAWLKKTVLPKCLFGVMILLQSKHAF